MNLSNLDKISKEELLSGSFGIEWECLRAHSTGELCLTPHPEIFGDKLKNPLVTTDFSESQIEIITPTLDSVDEAFDTFSLLSDLVNVSLPEDEYLWFQSIPCILPYYDKIPIAQYAEAKEGRESQKYREELAKKYGVKKQMISGVHFNFSFNDETIQKLYSFTEESQSYKEFKNEVYLKITRNYLRYCWLIIYLTGCSIGTHKTFANDCIHLMNTKDAFGSYYSTKGPSFRNASCGYKNLKNLYPSYKNVDEFTRDINNYIESGELSEAKELYTQIRLKPKNPSDLLNSLKNDGIEYIEIRTLDINPFYKCGLTKQDMKFLHLFLIFMFIKEESDYEKWQEEALINEERTAEKAYVDEMRLLKEGVEIKLKDWALELINEMYDMIDELGINDYQSLDMMLKRIENPDLTYGKRLLKMIKKEGYINTHTKLSMNNKFTSKNMIKNVNLDEHEELKKYVSLALRGL